MLFCHLILPNLLFYFYASDRLITFPILGEMAFSILEKWPFVGNVLCVQEVHFLLIIRAMYSKDAPYVSCMSPSTVVG